jgi:hypothetical protein
VRRGTNVYRFQFEDRRSEIEVLGLSATRLDAERSVRVTPTGEENQAADHVQ